MKEILARRIWSSQSMWVEAINRRLEALGVNENTPLLVMNKKNSGTMSSKSVEPALHWEKELPGGIEVKEEAAS